MYLLLSFCIHLVGFYILYNTSARAVFVKRKLTRWLCKHRSYSKIAGSLLLLTSVVLFMLELGIGVGFFFALLCFMVLSGYTIILLPLQKSKTLRS